MMDSVEDLKSLLTLPDNCQISNVSISPLPDSSELGFSSSLKQMTVQYTSVAVETNIGRDDGDAKTSVESDGVHVDGDAKTSGESDGVHVDGDGYANINVESDRNIHLVVKCMPDPSQWVALNSQTTFKKEFDMYSLMIPIYSKIIEQLTSDSLEHKDIPLFPKFFGGRLNMGNEPKHVDENAVILLENLKHSGYQNCKQSKLNGPLFRFVLEKAALLHAVGIIIQNDPKYTDAFQNLLKTTKPFFFGAQDENISKVNAGRRLKIINIVKRFGYAETVNERILEVLVKTDSKTLEESKSPYYSLIHNDLWINNIMFKYSKAVNDEETVGDLRFIDFQNTNFGSVTKEIALLLYTSVDHQIWKDLYVYSHHYHNYLLKHLKSYFMNKCELKFPFNDYSFENFEKEFKVYTCHKLKHIFIIMKILSGQDELLYESYLKRILDHCIQNGFI